MERVMLGAVLCCCTILVVPLCRQSPGVRLELPSASRLDRYILVAAFHTPSAKVGQM